MKSILTILITVTITNMEKVEIDGETADRIVVCSIKEYIKYLKEDITKLRKLKKPEPYQKQELADNIIDLGHLEAVLDMYGGNYG